RFYTNRRSNYVEVYGGNVYAGSPQSSAAHSLTRKDYVDAKFNSIPTAPVGDIMVGNDPSNTTSGVLQGHVTWHARNWAGRTTESASLMTWVNPTTGFKVVKAGTYYIEFTDYRRVRATGQDDTVSARIQVNNATKITNSCTARDNALATPTAKWVGHLNVNDTVRFISVGGEIIVGGGHFTIRYIKP
ncbi:hypothetical protein QNZ93_005166, partial [Vibrio parahaemolyticus]|nr:hypothetical protein [Vibrio parahaemolyticus]